MKCHGEEKNGSTAVSIRKAANDGRAEVLEPGKKRSHGAAKDDNVQSIAAHAQHDLKVVDSIQKVSKQRILLIRWILVNIGDMPCRRWTAADSSP